MSNKTTLKIDVYTDVICPWCYLGKRRMEKALESLQLQDVDVRYLPYELRPETPSEGVDRLKALRAKYGNGFQVNDERITMLGQEVGLDFHFEKIQKIPNTFDAHRLIWLAGQEGVQKPVVEALHEAYFTHGKFIGNIKTLAEIASASGLEAEKVKKILKSDEYSDEVRELEKKGLELGISGVPFFIFNNESAVSGAQPVEAFVSILKELTA